MANAIDTDMRRVGRAVVVTATSRETEIRGRVTIRFVGISRAIIMRAAGVSRRVHGIDHALAAAAFETAWAFVVREALPTADHLV